uniref:Uncharacterized protein n=1 Tax=Prolemur simus TaxID=1328070 RepID=A0A8C9AM33_PROSS
MKGILILQDDLEPSVFPIQKGSLNLLRQKWESSDYQRSECWPGTGRRTLLQARGSKLLEPEGEAVSAPKPPDPLSLPSSTGEEMLSSKPEEKCPEEKSDNAREYGPPEVLKEDSLSGRRRIERFSIALDELRSVFEAPKSRNRPAGPAEYGGKVRSH